MRGQKKYEARVYEPDRTEVIAKAETFDLELGHIRAVIAEADAKQMPDDSAVTFEIVREDYLRKDEYRVRVMHVRHEYPKGERP